MLIWRTTVCVIVLLSGRSAGLDTMFTGINTLLREYMGRSTTPEASLTLPEPDLVKTTPLYQHYTEEATSSTRHSHELYPVQHAAMPRRMTVVPLPLAESDHELMFNVTWDPPVGPPVQEYSLEVHSLTDTIDCRSNMCYEYNIPGESLWSVIPTVSSPVAEDCAVRPGCMYKVKLIAHPWDGHTAANLNVQLDECVAGVCSCAHAPRLPTPVVAARTVSIHGELYANVSWTLPPPSEPLRLPPRLKKQSYLVSIGKQMVSDAHPAPWFARTINRRVDAMGFVVVPDNEKSQLIPINERSDERVGKRSGMNILKLQSIYLDVKLLARVNLVDERGCIGPAGNATAYDPADVRTSSIGTYALWAVFGGACMLTMVAVLAFSARAVKRVLNEFRPATAPSVLQPLGHRPMWFPLSACVYSIKYY